LSPGRGGGRRAGDEYILKRVTSGDSPGARDSSIQPEFVSVAACSAGLNNPCGIVGICCSRIRAVQSIDCRRQRKITIQIPFRSQLVIAELFRFHLLRDGRQRRKLISGAWKIRHAVVAVDRKQRSRFDDEACARRYEIVDAAQSVAISVVVILQVEIVESETGDHLDMAGQW